LNFLFEGLHIYVHLKLRTDPTSASIDIKHLLVQVQLFLLFDCSIYSSCNSTSNKLILGHTPLQHHIYTSSLLLEPCPSLPHSLFDIYFNSSPSHTARHLPISSNMSQVMHTIQEHWKPPKSQPLSDGTNYKSWAGKAEAILMTSGIWKYIQ
jgi:hypothetical protein